MTIVALELALVAFDYLLFLFAPLIKHLMQRLGLKKQNANSITGTGDCDLHQWLAIRIHTKGGRKRKSGRQLSLLDRLNGELQDFFGWQQRELTESLEERTALLRRTEGLIKTKWPWIACYPTLTDSVDRQINCWPYDLCLVADWDFPSLLPAVGASLVANKDKTGEGKLEQMKIIYSNPSEQRFLLQVECPSVSLDSYAGRLRRLSVDKTSKRQTKTLCVRWLTKDEFSIEADRSGSIFYYTQILPDLAPLFSILVELLDAAQLLEPSLKRAPSDCSPSGKEDQPRKLTRYQLVLMLVAYLQQSESKLSLSAKLTGFLDTYAQLANAKSIRISPTSDRRLQLDVIDSEQANLDILDPASKSEKKMSVGMGLSLGKLFIQLSRHIKSVDEPADGLQSLLELALAFAGLGGSKQRGEERAKPLEVEESKPLMKKQISSDSIDSLEIMKAAKKATKIDSNPLAWDSSILKGFWAQLKWRKILTNALYVMILLLIRNMMLNYLENLQHDLRAEASDDLVQFRKIIFDSSHSQANQRKQEQIKQSRKREPEDPIVDDMDQGSTPKESKQATSGQTAPLGGGGDGGDFGMDVLMESMMQQMFANLANPGADAGAGAGPAAGPQSEDAKRLMELMSVDGEEWGEDEEAAKMAEIKQLLEKITGRQISDEELNMDISEEEFARKMESLNLSALGLDGMDDDSDEYAGLEGGDIDYDEDEEDDDELPAIASSESPASSQVKDEL